MLTKIYGPNDVLTEQKKQKKIEDVIDDVIKEPLPTNDYWRDEDIFSTNDKQPTIDATKMIVDDIKEPTNNILNDIDIKALSDNILRNLRPRDNRTIQELIDDDFIPIDDGTPQERMDDDNISLQREDDKVTIKDVLDPDEVETRPPLYKIVPPKQNIVTIEDIFKPPMAGTIPPTAPPKTLDIDINAFSDNILRNLRPVGNRNLQNLIDDDFIPINDRTQQEKEDDDNISLAGEAPPLITIDTTNAWDQNKTEIARAGPAYKLSTDIDRKLKAANKIKKKYLRKKIGQRNLQNKISVEWLKTAGFLDTKDQDKINYIFVPPKKKDTNNILGDAGHFIRTQIDNTDFKKENLASKMKGKNVRKPYLRPKTDKNDGDETIKILDNIAVLEPGKSAQIAAKKIGEKYKKIREAKAKKRFKLPGEVAVGDTIETKDREKIEIVLPLSKISSQKAAKKITDKYDRLRRNKIKSKKIVEFNKKKDIKRN